MINDESFYVCDLEDVCKKYYKWLKLLPRVQPFYAIKCNPDIMVIKLLAYLGAGFDCASKKELQTIVDLGISSDCMIFANPCKQNSHIQFARENNIDKMTFDNSDELYKIKQIYPDSKYVLFLF